MSDHTAYQVADQIKAVLAAYAPLSGWNVVIAGSEDIAEEDTEQTIVIGLVAASLESELFSSGNTQHTATFETEAVTDKDANGALPRNAMAALAHINAAIMADQAGATPVITVFDIVPLDVGTPANGVDVTAVSLQWRIQWVTPRADWTTFSPN